MTKKIKHFHIYYYSDGCIVHNTKKDFDGGHTHLRSYKYAETLVKNCLKKRKPKTRNGYLLDSHIIVSTDHKYIELIEQLKNKETNKYININRGVSR